MTQPTKPVIYFKATFLVDGMKLDNTNQKLNFKIGSFRVTLRSLNTKEKSILNNPSQNCLAFFEFKTDKKCNPKIYPIFQQWVTGEAGKLYPMKNGYQEVKELYGNKVRTPLLEDMPQNFQDYLGQIKREMSHKCRQVAGSFLWRFGLDSPMNPLLSYKLFWSFDKKEWHELETDLIIRAFTGNSFLRMSELAKKNIKKEISKYRDFGEPLYHEILKEAKDIMMSSPRSGLILAVSALEVGVKRCIQSLSPDTEWLLENLASPSVEKILTEYLPNLSKNKGFNNKSITITNSIKELIKKAISKRNKIIHTGHSDIDYDFLDKVNDAIKSCLWILDYYSGNDWAIFFLEDDLLKELGINPHHCSKYMGKIKDLPCY